MEGDQRRKRKMEKEESEEEQMEKFFALIKSTKDARDRFSKEKEEEKAKGVWKPTFQPEDFMDDEELAKINVLRQTAGPSGKETKEEAPDKESPEATAQPQAPNGKNEKPSDDLDLTLSL
ncbi:NIM1-INTERACTING 3 [Spatholobus suberectus]|nr:NIM1-INTERACTING 3 [Spatholobus suberectus]